MSLIAVRNLLQERARLVISAAGVAFAILLMLILLGIYRGAITQFTMVVERNPAHLFVTREGITDFFHGVSLISPEQIRRIEQADGVAEVVPAVVQRVVLERHGTKLDTVVFSVTAGSNAGAPWKVSDGRRQPRDGEIVVSRVLATKLGKTVGDRIDMQGTSLRIAGLAEESSSLGNHYSWVTLRQARRMLESPNLINFGYVTVDDPAAAGAVATAIQRDQTGLAVLDKQRFLANNRQELEQSFLPIIQAMVGIALLIGVCVIGLTIYTATIDKTREYGILKAIGVSNRQLYLIVLVQTLAATFVGLVFGSALALVVARGLAAWIDLRPEISAQTLLAVGALGVVMALVASLFPVRRLVRIDPAEVFRTA